MRARAHAHTDATHTEQLSDGTDAISWCAIALDVQHAGPRGTAAGALASVTSRDFLYFKIQVQSKSTQAGLGVDRQDDLLDSAQRVPTLLPSPGTSA